MNACSTTKTFLPGSQVWNFHYIATNQGQLNLIRAFDNGERTILQFTNLDNMKLSIMDEDNQPISYEQLGQYALLPRLYDFVVIQVGAVTVTVTTYDKAFKTRAKPFKQPVFVDSNVEQAKLKVAHQEIAKQKAKLNHLFLNAKVTITAHFDYGSVIFHPSNEIEEVLLEGAKRATQINIRGYTDSTIAGPRDKAVANGRAQAAQKYFLESGVSKEKIKISSFPSGNFLASNKTAEGRLKNRRVEIEFIGRQL